MTERFALNRQKLGRLYDESVENTLNTVGEEYRREIVVDLELFLVERFDDPRFHEAPPSECLAWLVYLAGISTCWVSPDGFGAKSVLAHSVRGPIVDDGVLIQVAATELGYSPVYVGPFDADQFLDGEPTSIAGWRRQIVDSVEAMLAVADPLIATAREAARQSGY